MIGSYHEYVDSKVEWINEIPNSWGITKIKRIAKRGYKTFIDGDWIESEFIISIGIRLIQTGEIKVGYYNNQGHRYISEKTFNELNCTEVFPNDVLICRLASPVGRACLAPDNKERMITAVDNCILKPSDEYDERFIVYFLSSFNYLDYLENISRGSTRDRISRSLLGSIEFPIVFKTEQQKIAEFLDHKTALIDKFITNRKKQIELLEEKKAAIINKAVTKGINPNVKLKPTGVEWIGDIPEHWGVWKIKYLGRIINGYAFKSNDFTHRGIRVLKISNIQTMYIDLEDKSFVKEKLYEDLIVFRIYFGDLVFALTRPIISTGIKASIYDKNDKALLNQRNAVFRASIKIKKEFLYYIIFNKDFIQEFESLIDETGQQPNISAVDIGNIKIPLPTEREQKEIIEFLREEIFQIDTLISKYQKQIELIQEYKTVLISKAVTGKIDVRDWQKPVNSILNKMGKQ